MRNELCTHQDATNNGSCWSSQGHPNWNVVQTTLNYNPTEWQIYAAGAQGKAHCSSPDQSPVVIRDSGSPFDPSWEGVVAFYLQQSGRENPAFRVASVFDKNTLALDRVCNVVGSQTFHFISTINSGAVNVEDDIVTWNAGQEFNVFAIEKGAWRIDGAWHTCHNITPKSARCDTKGVLKGVGYHSYQNTFDQVTNWRLQKVIGANEENLTCTARAVGSYDCRPLATGKGSLWPWYLGNGFSGAPSYQAYRQISLNPDGTLSLGCARGCESLLIDAGSQARESNYLHISAGYEGSPTISAQSRKKNESVGLTFTSTGMGQVLFAGNNGLSQILFLQPGNGEAALSISDRQSRVDIEAKGKSRDIDIALIPKGSGAVNIGAVEKDVQLCGNIPNSTGCMKVKDERGVIRFIPLF